MFAVGKPSQDRVCSPHCIRATSTPGHVIYFVPRLPQQLHFSQQITIWTTKKAAKLTREISDRHAGCWFECNLSTPLHIRSGNLRLFICSPHRALLRVSSTCAQGVLTVGKPSQGRVYSFHCIRATSTPTSSLSNTKLTPTLSGMSKNTNESSLRPACPPHHHQTKLLAHVAPKILKGVLSTAVKYSTEPLLVSRALITGNVLVSSIECRVYVTLW